MPRASWRGYLRLSLVSCPVYLLPATVRTKPIRLHQVWRAPPAEQEQDGGQNARDRSAPRLTSDYVEDRAGPATRITLRPHDPNSGEELEKEEVVRGYEYQRGRYVTFTPDDLKALHLESSKVINLEMFVSRGEVDPVYFNSSYYLYADGPIAVEALRVIGAAMAEAGVVGIGRLTLSRRERVVMVEPRGTGMALFSLRTADEVRAAQFGSAEGDLDIEMVAIARAIIARRAGNSDPTAFRDRYQEALQTLIETKLKGLAVKPREVITPPLAVDLMSALKCSLAQEPPATGTTTTKGTRAKPTADRRQRSL